MRPVEHHRFPAVREDHKSGILVLLIHLRSAAFVHPYSLYNIPDLFANDGRMRIVAMVFFFAVFAARAPAMGNSADRAWQLSQLVEGVLTAFNPSHGSLSYVQAGHCVSKQIGRHDAACQGCPRCVSRSPEARCLRVFARTVRFSQPAVLSALLVIQLFGIVIPPPIFP